MAEQPSFAALLRHHRLAAGLTQEGLARQAYLSVRGIADLERGARTSPFPSTTQRLCDALRLDAAQQVALFAAARRRPSSTTTRRPGAEPTIRHNLPATLTSFVGRARELASVEARLATARLLTLTGVGGCGKTRLALEVARAMLEAFPDGVWLVELAPLEDPAQVPRAVAAVLGVREHGSHTLLATLALRLRERRLLLVLDNSEHLLQACAETVGAIVRACPTVHVLATSRESLGLTGEVAWRVPSLAVPDPRRVLPLTDLERTPAVELFVERAKDAEQRFVLTERNAAAVVHVCQQLDGLPLALELAAAMMQALSAEPGTLYAVCG
jgi:transcriptional regulator with XRE-family HTH domain